MRRWFHKLLAEKSDWNFQKADLREIKGKLENPSRGWYRIYTFEVEKTPDFQPMLWCDLEGDTLVMIILNIGAYKEKALDEQGLEHIREILRFFAKKQYEIILRITYDHEGKALEREPFFFSVVTGHMQQLIPVWKEFCEHIFVYQGLLIGNWGEMHTSRFLHPLKLKELWRILKAESSEEIFCAVRKPSYWRLLHPNGEKDNMGLFDDAIFGSENHLGTFGTLARSNAAWDVPWRKADEMEFEDELCKTVPNGGEAICGEQYLALENPLSTIETLRKMHITYLNKEYDKKLLRIWKDWKWIGQDVWQSSSLYEYIESHLGYRFLVKDVKLTSVSNAEQEGIITIEVENVGFANFYEEAEVLLEQIEDSGDSNRWVLDTDIRSWDVGKVTEVTVRIPKRNSKLYLSVSRKRDARSICFANQRDVGDRVLLGQVTFIKNSIG
ncbi:MAG: DUF4832 domain-containing protein [Lachnospiraceae bacterium]|nr:DUF4832 domain-containing protein [Lachnospiraceae bacterium]